MSRVNTSRPATGRSCSSFGLNWNRDAVEKYKIALFVEWPILETYRKQILDQMDYYLDLNQPKQPVMTAVPSLRRMISDIAGSPLRVKPFYAPGVWGGQLPQAAG